MRGRQSVRKGIWYLGGRRRIRRRKNGQREGFLQLAELLGAAAGPIIGEIAKPLLKKNYWWEKEKPMRQNILLRRHTTSQRIRLPNG